MQNDCKTKDHDVRNVRKSCFALLSWEDEGILILAIFLFQYETTPNGYLDSLTTNTHGELIFFYLSFFWGGGGYDIRRDLPWELIREMELLDEDEDDPEAPEEEDGLPPSRSSS